MMHFFNEKHDYKSVLCVMVNMYVQIFWGLDAHGGRKLITCAHTRTHIHMHMGQLLQPLLCMCTEG